jgi:cytochrome b subunit of formate dehydrogenase
MLTISIFPMFLAESLTWKMVPYFFLNITWTTFIMLVRLYEDDVPDPDMVGWKNKLTWMIYGTLMLLPLAPLACWFALKQMNQGYNQEDTSTA